MRFFLKNLKTNALELCFLLHPHVLPRVPPAEACEHATCASPPTHRTGTGTCPHHLFDLVLNYYIPFSAHIIIKRLHRPPARPLFSTFILYSYITCGSSSLKTKLFCSFERDAFCLHVLQCHLQAPPWSPGHLAYRYASVRFPITFPFLLLLTVTDAAVSAKVMKGSLPSSKRKQSPTQNALPRATQPLVALPSRTRQRKHLINSR